MISGQDLGAEVLDLGKAIGLFDSGGNLDASWFGDPLQRLESVLSNQTQRDALLDLLDAVAESQALSGISAGEKWHPLLGEQPRGNAYLTVRNGGPNALLGLAGTYSTPEGSTPAAELRVHLPLVSSDGTNVTAVAGTVNGAFKLELRVHLGWTRPAQSIGLDAISLSATLSFLPPQNAAASFSVLLEKLQLDDQSPPQDTVLDPQNIETEAIKLIIGFIHENLSRIAAPAGEVAAVANHLVPLLGYGGDGIPNFPFLDMVQNPLAVRSWFASMLHGGGTPFIATWLSHLGGLFGSADTTVSGTGTPSDPWRVGVISLGGPGSGIDVTLATSTEAGITSLLTGVELILVPAGGSPPARIEAQATLASIPLSGTGPVAVLPSLSIAMRAPGSPGAPALVNAAQITVNSARAGLMWNGTSVQPLLQLEQVTLAGTSYPRLDLTNADSVVSAVSGAVRDQVRNALGNGPGRHLAVLAGIAPPADDPSSTHLIDPALLVTSPARAIAAVHRAVLLDNAHSWSHMLSEIAAIAGVNTPVTGTGIAADPWRVALDSVGPLAINLVAWNAAQGGNPADPQKLRLGVAITAAAAPIQFSWIAELFAFDLPQSGDGSVSMMAGQHASLMIQPLPAPPPIAGMSVGADSFGVKMDWSPGSPIAFNAGLNNLTVTGGANSVVVPMLSIPPPGGIDFSNPAATAAGLGLSVPNLELVLRMVLARAALSWGGMPAYTLAGLFGIHGNLVGFQNDWPTLGDPAAPGSLFTDPFAALRDWLGHVAIDVSADGSAFLPQGLAWLRALISGALPDVADAAPPIGIGGSGTYDDPWALAPDRGNTLQALFWIEPAGPPPLWAAPLAGRANAASDFPSLFAVLWALRPFMPVLADALALADLDQIASSLGNLDQYLQAGDGVVPVASQIPTGGNWMAGTPIAAPHHLQPSDPSAITQILTQIDNWAGGAIGQRAVLLLGPAFSDHSIWNDLLASPNRHGSTDLSANFNLRVPGVQPAAVDLTGVTAVVDYYTADLNDDGSGDLTGLTAQIARLVARVGQLRPGVPITLVAHSTAGVPARAFTAGPAGSAIRGLVTLGTPHLGAPLPFMTDSGVADAVRMIQAIVPSAPGTDPILNALAHIVAAMDGMKPASAPGALPSTAPYPVGSFNFAGSSTDTGGRPALALGGTLTGRLLDAIKTATAALATTAANPVAPPPAPTHIGVGVRAALPLPSPSPADLTVDASARADVFRIKLHDGVADPPRPAHALRVRTRLSRPGGWLAGGASSYVGPGLPTLDTRVRWAELGVNINTDGGLHVDPVAQFHQASLHSPMAATVRLADTQAQALLGETLRAISNARTGSPVAILLEWLQGIGIAVPDPHGGIGLSADAFNAISVDAAGFLGPRLGAALDAAGGIGGFTGPAGGPWTMSIGSLPLEAYLSANPWRAGLRTTPPGTGYFPIAQNLSVTFDAGVSIPDFAPSLDASINLGALSLAWSQQASQLTLQAQPWLAPLVLMPKPDGAALKAALDDALPRLLFSGAASALLESLMGPGFNVGPLDAFFSSPGTSIAGGSAIGNGSGGLDAAKLTAVLQAINGALGLPAGPGLSLPASLQVTASGAGTDLDPVVIALGTRAPIAGVIGIQAGLAFDSHLHVSPNANISVTISPLPGGVGWTGVVVAFGASPAGVTLSVTPQPDSPIQILPSFSGLGALAGALEALLPRALDELVAALSSGGTPPLLALVLDVVTALNLYDNAGKFAAHADQLKPLLATNWTSGLGLTPAAQNQVATAIANLFGGGSPLSGAIPDSITASGPAVTWSYDLAAHGLGAGTISATVGWDNHGPTAKLGLAGVKLDAGAISIDLNAGYAAAALQMDSAIAAHLQQSLGLDLTPKLGMSLSGSDLHLQFLPLASNANDGPLTIDVAPNLQVNFGAGTPEALVEGWLLPLVIDLLFNATKAHLGDSLFAGGPTLETVLVSAQLINKGANPSLDTIKTPTPDLPTIVTGAAAALATGVSVAVTDTLTMGLVDDGGRLGVRLSGHEDFAAGSLELSLRLGAPSDWGGGVDEGLVLYVFQTGTPISFRPGLHVVGVGLGISGQGDSALINTEQFRLGGARGYLFFDYDFQGSPSSFGGGLELDAIGLPLGQATGGGVGGNPIAASLLKSNGGASGDSHPVNPGIDVAAWLWSGPDGDGQFHVKFNGKDDPKIWIGVHAGFGPIYIDQIGVEITDDPGIALLIDGSVKVDGLTAQADELGVRIPFNAIASPDHWSLDLKGLGIGFSSAAVTIAGGMLKNDGPPIEYDGMLLIQIAEFGFIAVGAYSTPTEGGDTYTSLFVLLDVFITIGIPPVIDITGFGLGVGYNRELLVPTIDQVPNFILVSALDDPQNFANDPMGELMQIRSSLPAKRGSFWLAVGLRGQTFVVVQITAVVYVVLDRGVEIGVLGVARMELPSDDSALVSVELALKARYSSSEGILSIQAQLTDNSWLLSRDCQLTGGFAYFMWFPESQFVLTLGGYHPAFAKPPQFPDVPRLGYRWSLLGVINIKGESYFALTNTCVMAGTRMDTTYGPDWIHVWYTAYADFLISWDPFHYDVDVGIQIGVALSVKICFFGCVTIGITLSLGATLHVIGPPLHGEVKIDIAVASVTIRFGPDPNPAPNYIDWNPFTLKYLYGGDPNGYAVASHVLTGLIPPEPSGAQPSPGSQDQPWRLTSEFSFQTETRMPANQYIDFISGDSGLLASTHSVDAAPMNKENVGSVHSVVIEGWNAQANTWSAVSPSASELMFTVDGDHFTITPVIGQVSEATWHWTDPSSVPAAARTLPTLVGVTIVGKALATGQSALIPIGKLVDDGLSRPLPFAFDIDVMLLKQLGATAEAIAQIAASAGSSTTIAAASSLLSGSGFFAQARASAGLPPPGLDSFAVRALTRARSSPPTIAPITTGLTMKPVGLPAPPQIKSILPVGLVALTNPRLRAVMQGRPQPAKDAPPSVRTTVSKIAPKGVLRMTAPKLEAVAGARLDFVPAPNGPRPTAIARSGRTMRNPELGWASGRAHSADIEKANAAVAGQGVTLSSGTTHIWDLPISEGTIAVRGVGAARIALLTRGGAVLSDRELVVAREISIPIPAGCAMVAITALGKVPAGAATLPGFGSVSMHAAPQGGMPVVGWQAADLLTQAGPTTLLARGASVNMARHATPRRKNQKISQAAVRATKGIGTQVGVETSLPPQIEVVAVMLDQQDASAADDGDLAIAVTGAKLSSSPMRVVGGRHKALIYDVTERSRDADHIVVAVASRAGWRLAGVVGLPGNAQEWAVRMNGNVPEQLVPEGPLTPDGEITVTLSQPVRGAA